jgi:hypothetical protein
MFFQVFEKDSATTDGTHIRPRPTYAYMVWWEIILILIIIIIGIRLRIIIRRKTTVGLEIFQFTIRTNTDWLNGEIKKKYKIKINSVGAEINPVVFDFFIIEKFTTIKALYLWVDF